MTRSPGVALVATTSLRPADLLRVEGTKVVDTPFGLVELQRATVSDKPVLCLSRSGGRELLPPHRVNYRANVLALALSGVRLVLATHLVGSLRTDLPVGSMVVPDQFIDLTRDRPKTLFDRYGHRFTDFTDPYCPTIRQAISTALAEQGVTPHSGCYVGVDGPRFETAAEVRMFGQLGGTVVGMTGTTEAILFREANICFGSLALVSNLGAGLATGGLEVSDMLAEASERHRLMARAVLATLSTLVDGRSASCDARRCRSGEAGLTVPAWRDEILTLTRREQRAEAAARADPTARDHDP